MPLTLRCVCHVASPWLGAPSTSARALQCVPPMPRKQRFKPSRKPQSNQGTAPSQQIDDRKDIIPEQQAEDRNDAPVISNANDVE